MNKDFQRGSSEIDGLLSILFLIGLGVWFFAGGERDGVVKYQDCREIVKLQPDTYQKYYKTFTCDIARTVSGKSMGGECVHIEYDGSFLSQSRGCNVAFVYTVKQDAICNDKNYPNLGTDDKCYAPF